MSDTDLLALEHVTIANFAPRVGERFTLEGPDGGGELTLVACQALGPSLQREAFSLTFVGAAEHALEQRIHRLHNRELGALEIFLVPIGADSSGIRYEATFN